MPRVYLGEFEELVLLLVATFNGEAYGVGIKEALAERANRSVNISAVHAALRRLESKGFVSSRWSEATAQRGGRRKKLFTISNSGIEALKKLQDLRVQLWQQIPGLAAPILGL